MFSPIKLVNNTGLASEKNLCFVNSALQLLYCIPRVRVFFKSKEFRLASECGREMKICDEIARLFNSEKNFNSSAAELRSLVSIASGRLYLHNGSQQDSLEFLITLLQEIDEEISFENWEAKTVIQEFGGEEKLEKRFLNKRNGICSKCKTKPRDELEKFKVLQLNIPDTSRVLTLNGVVKNYFTESSDSASMKCECCKHRDNCPQTGVCKPKAFSSKKIVVKSPDVLLVQINRFSNMTGLKLKTTIWPDDIIQFPTGDEYKLYGIGHHLGEYHGQGHFIASLRNDQSWVRCNDTDICNSNESDAKSLECNLCVYSKIFNSETPFVPTNDWQNLHGRKAPGGLHYSFGLKGNYAKNIEPTQLSMHPH